MNKKEIAEIKKLYKDEICSVRKIVGCYVDAERNIKATFSDTFLTKDETERFKYLEIFKKGLSGTVGKNLRTFDMPNDNPMRDSLLALRDSDLEDETLINELFQKIIDNYNQVENYLILLINNAYDIVKRGTDGALQESEDVYGYISCYVCPVALEKPGLTFNAEKGCFEHKDRRWCLEAPVVSFIYPSFEDRCEDINYITTYSKKTDNTYSDFIDGLLDLDTDLSPKEQMEGFQMVVESVIKNNPEKMDVVKNIHETIHDKLENTIEPIKLDKSEIRMILKDSGIQEEALEEFDEEYNSIFGENSVSADCIINSKILEVKSPDVVVKVNSGKTNAVQSKTIDGKKCLVIDIGANNSVEVNGINL